MCTGGPPGGTPRGSGCGGMDGMGPCGPGPGVPIEGADPSRSCMAAQGMTILEVNIIIYFNTMSCVKSNTNI